MVPVLLVLNILIRIFRVPDRRFKTREGRFIVAPADGHIKYIKLNEANTIPEVSVGDRQCKLDELVSYDLTKQPYWTIGISITPFDVHKLAAPVSGKIILNRQYIDNTNSNPVSRIKRKTTLFDNGIARIGVVQTLPGRIKRIVTYLNENDLITKGEWFGEIRFGAQIDIIIPNSYFIELNINDQAYAGKSVISYTQNKEVILAE
jgi:phosphatidylserine decarboxylase precursor-related protein